MVERLRRDPGLALLLLALVLAAALYAPTLTRGTIDYDDPWLIRSNWVVQHPSLHAIFFDTSTATRHGLGAEYLPVRDLSIALDYAIWGDWYQGFHLTQLVIYLAALALWFAALARFGVSRTVAGLAVLIFAVHPSHAESVAWLSERKGVLALAWTGAAFYGYARYRAGESRWLVLAAIAAVAAVWSKAPSAFALAALAGFELLPGRVSWRRSAIALAVVGAVTAAAFVPVLWTARSMGVVASSARSVSWLGIHGFYVKLAAMAVPNAISYPIATGGASAVELVLGALGLAAAIGAAAWPRVPALVRAAAILWLLSWFPNSRIALPVVKIVVADRYLMFGSLAVAIAAAAGIVALRRFRAPLVAAIVVAAGVRTLDAQSAWSDERTLWEHAVASNPQDGLAWSSYAEALAARGEQALADAAVARGLAVSRDPELLHRAALFELARGDRAAGLAHMRQAAEAGFAHAMSNLALELELDHHLDEALAWAQRATEAEPMYPNGHRIYGKMLLAAQRYADALAEYERTLALEPGNLENRLNLGVALVALGRNDEARPHLVACLLDPRLAPRARALLAMADRH